jgi:hypothetical protein
VGPDELDSHNASLVVDPGYQPEMVPLDVEDRHPVAFADWPGLGIFNLQVFRVLLLRRHRFPMPRPQRACGFASPLMGFDEVIDSLFRYDLHRPVTYMVIFWELPVR